MIIDKHINKDNWYEIKDILPQITVNTLDYIILKILKKSV